MEKTVGERIAELRKKAGFTQKEMAKKLNVSDKSVSRWERDENLPDLYMAHDIASKLFFYISELCSDVSGKTSEKAVSAKKELTKKAMVTFGIIVTAFVMTVCYLHLGDIVEFIYCTLIFAPISVIACTTVSVILWDNLETKGKFR